MRRLIIASSLVIALVVIGFVLLRRTSEQQDGLVIIRGETFAVEIADEEQEQVQGLSGRDGLCQRCGMLFVYTKAAPRTFWMKEMNFSLDFVWIREGKIVELTQNVPPPSVNEPPAIVNPRELSDTVLEVPAGTIARLGWQVSDRVGRK